MAYIVENDDLAAEVISGILSTDKRYLVELVQPTRLAVNQMAQRAEPQDIIVIDIILGDELDGFDVVRSLVKEQFEGRIVLVSGYDPAYLSALRDIAREKGLHILGALEKPFRNAELMSLVQEA